MLFIYWGWDTAVAVNEETKDRNRTPGLAAILSTFILLVTYALVIFSMQAFAGVGSKGNGLGNTANRATCCRSWATPSSARGGFGPVLTHLLMLMVLSSAAASTQTTILPTARTTLSMAAYKALPSVVREDPPRFLTPTVSTVIMGADLDRDLRPLNYTSNGSGVIADAVIAIGLYIAFYYGLTAFACVWYYRKNADRTARRNLWMQRHPAGDSARLIMCVAAGACGCDYAWRPRTATRCGRSGPALADRRLLRDRVAAALVGVIVCLYCRNVQPGALLQEADPHPRDPDPGPGQVADLTRPRLLSLAGQPRSLPSCRSGPGRTNHAPFDRMIASGSVGT